MEILKPSEVTFNIVCQLIWKMVPPRSFISGLWLRDYEKTPDFKRCFLRILPVKDFRYFAFYARNIVMCTPEENDLWKSGTEEQRINYSLDIEEKSQGRQKAEWGQIKTLQTSLETEYKKIFPYSKGLIVGYRYSLQEQQEIIGELNKRFFNRFLLKASIKN